MPRKRKIAPVLPDPVELFAAARIMQSAQNSWTSCRHWRCIAKSRCIGGPRGTCRATGGFPFCSEEGKRRLDMYKGRHQWQPEIGHENEGAAEREGRHIEVMAKRAERQIMVMELDTERKILSENLKKLQRT